MRVTAFYDRSSNDLSLDKELEKLVGKRHQHSGVQFSTMTRDITWEFDNKEDATEAHSSLSKHDKVQDVVLS
jgi:hypothetical protein